MNKLLTFVLLSISFVAFAQNDFPWSNAAPAVVNIADTSGCANTTYTFSLRTGTNTITRIRSFSQGGNAGIFEITFPAGTNFGALNGTVKGVTIDPASFVITGTKITFEVPGNDAIFINNNESFTVVINNVFNPSSGTYAFIGGTVASAQVRAFNSQGGWNFNSCNIGNITPTNCNDRVFKISPCPPGSTCADSYPIASLPFFQNNMSTCGFGNDYTTTPCGANNFMGGEDFIFTYNSPGNECISITIENASARSGLFLLSGCPSSGASTCIASNTQMATSKALNSISINNPGTYYIVVSTNPAPNCTPFDIFIEQNQAPSNDAPCNAVLLDLGIFVGGNNSCSGNFQEPSIPGCWTAGTANTVWYKVVAPTSGNLKIRTLANSLLNTQVAVYQGNCNSLTMISGGCNLNGPSCGSTADLSSRVNLTGLTPGATYFIRVDGADNLTGSFNIIAVDGNQSFPGAYGQECGIEYSLPLCSPNYTVANQTYTGIGNTCDFPGGGGNCLASAERGSTWFTISINANGSLNFNIIPNDYVGGNPGAETDYDFAIWKIGGSGAVTCDQIAAGSVPIRCNYSALGVTGLSPNGNSPTAYPGFDGAYEPQLNVVAGDIYILVVSNFSLNTSGYVLNINSASPVSYQNSANPPKFLVWSGTVSTDWNNADNWGGCGVPTCGITAKISSTAVMQPIISTNVTCKDLQIAAGARVTLNAGVKLSLCGSFENLGSFRAGVNSTVEFIGDTIQSLSGNFTAADQFYNLSVNKSAGYVKTFQEITVRGDFTTINNTSFFELSGRKLNIGGDFAIFPISATNSTFHSGIGGELLFNGGSKNFQNYTNIDTIDNVILQNGNGGVNLLTTMRIGLNNNSGSLTLIDGVIRTNSEEVIMINRNANAVTLGNQSSYVEGDLRRYLNTTGPYNFPVGEVSKGYQLINFNFTSATSISNLKANFKPWGGAEPIAGPLGIVECNGNFDILDALDNGYWTVDAFNAAGTNIVGDGVYTATLFNRPGSYTNPGFIVTVQKKPTSAGVWALQGNCATSNVNQVVRTGMSGFSKFSTAQAEEPQLYISMPDTVCSTEPIFTINIIPATGTFTSTSPGYSSGTFNPSIATLGYNYVTYTADINGVPTSITDSTFVVVKPSADINPLSDTTFCDGGKVTLVANIPSAGISYQWLYNGFPIPDSTNYTFTANSSGNYSVIVRNLGACPDTSRSIQVISFPYPNTFISSDGDKMCPGDTIVLTSDTTTGNDYQWILNGNPITGATNALYSTTNIGNYSVIITNAFNCNATTDVLTITNYDLPNNSIANLTDTTYCEGGSVLLSAFNAANYTYQWFFNGDTLRNEVSDTLLTFIDGNYFVLVIDTLTSCKAISRVIRTVQNPNPNVSFTLFNSDSIICQGQEVVFQANDASVYQLLYNGVPISGATSSTSPAIFTTDSAGLYSVIAENTFGCRDTSRVIQVSIFPAANASIATLSTQFCPLDSVMLYSDSTTGNNYQWFLNGNLISNATNVTYYATQPGNYTVEVTNQFGCKDTSTVVILSYFNLPDVNVDILGDTIFCSGDSVIFTAVFDPNYSYQWQLNNTTLTGATSNSLIATLEGIYNVIVINPNEQCPNISRGITVTYYDNPIALVQSTDTSLCVGENATLTASSGNTYQWMYNNFAISGANSSTFLTDSVGVYNVIITNTFGCKDTSNAIQIIVNSLPITQFITIDSVFCEGSNANLVSNLPNNNTIQWLYNNTTIAGATNSSITPNQTGNYSFLQTNEFGCISTSRMVTVTKLDRPIAEININSDSTLCPNETTVLNVNSGMQNYEWYYNNTILTSTTLANITVSDEGQYFAIITDNNGCKDTSRVVTIIANPLPNVTLSYDDTTVCSGLNTNFNVVSVSGNSYQWYFNNVVISGANGANYQAGNTGYYFVVVTNSLGCIDTSQIIKSTQVDYPVAEINVTDSIACEGQNIILQVPSSLGSNNIQWLKDDLVVQGASAMSFSVNATGNYSVVFTNSEGCSDTSRSVYVEVFPKPIAEVSALGNANLCSGENVTLQTSNTNGIIQWMNNNFYLTGENTSQIIISNAGNYSIEFTSTNGCKDTSNVITVQVSTYPEINLISSALNNQICSGNAVTISANSQSTYSYLWYRNDIQITNVFTNTISTTTSGEYKVIVTNNGLCSLSDSLNIRINPLPSVSPGIGGLICKGESFKLNGITNANLFEWRDADGNLVSNTNLQPEVFPIINTSYTLFVTDSNSCNNSASVQVRVKADINASLYVEFSSGIRPFLVKFYNSSENADKYLWDFGDGNTSEEFEPSHEYLTPGSYDVTLIANSGNCSDDTIFSSIQVIDLLIPTAISPNGDRVNDIWIIDHIEKFPLNEVEIFNQWGNLVYSKQNYTNDWDGGNLPDGTYFYIVKLGNNILPINGYLMIMR
jgi:gliding motility-associated-like protein